MALSVKQLQDKKARLTANLATAEGKVVSIQEDIAEVDTALQSKTAELQAQIDEINGITNTENKTEEVI